mmetsp:Transcript_38863/g.92011  ORF Transcript_38863/g.92011 Transcript_38863/m.92011 type:complete len:252 (+) Transcript_38863:1414-2169(+)
MKSLKRPPPSTPASTAPNWLTNWTRILFLRPGPSPLRAANPSSTMKSRRMATSERFGCPTGHAAWGASRSGSKGCSPGHPSWAGASELSMCLLRAASSRLAWRTSVSAKWTGGTSCGLCLRSTDTSIWKARARSWKGTRHGACRRTAQARLCDSQALSKPPRPERRAATSDENRSWCSSSARNASGAANLLTVLRSLSCLSSRPAPTRRSARRASAGPGALPREDCPSTQRMCHRALLRRCRRPSRGAAAS